MDKFSFCYYAFGQYSLCLQSELFECVWHWRAWSSFGRDTVLHDGLYFEISAENDIGLLEPWYNSEKNGWCYTFHNGRHLNGYWENGKLQCAFVYENFNRFSILVHPELPWRYQQIALQYAMLLGLVDRAFGFHGVTIICQDQVVILSAPSGTGKSTLGRLLHDHCGAAIVNGDFALLAPESDGSLMFEPTPFCGTSGVCHNYRLKVDRIVFLEQAKENAFIDLAPIQALARLLSNTFVPTWDGEKAGLVHQSALRAVASVPMSVFAFAPTGEAAEMFHSLVTQGRTPKRLKEERIMENNDIRKEINEIDDDALDMVAGGTDTGNDGSDAEKPKYTIGCPFCGAKFTSTSQAHVNAWRKNHLVCCSKNPCK